MLDGLSIPQFGLGVYEMSDREVSVAVTAALEAGYRHIDTAEWCVCFGPERRRIPPHFS